MFEFHKDKGRYFNWQYRTSKEYIFPFVQDLLPAGKKWRVLEIGCAEGGVLKPFLEEGHHCLGIELQESRYEMAREFFKEERQAGKIDFINQDIYDIDPERDLNGRFDLIILKDVIEHIHEQERFIPKLKDFLTPDGVVFFGFPPWYMPFGGHQQVLKNKMLSKLPYYHILPMPLYKGILKLGGETKQKIANVAEIKETGISIERFEQIVNRSGLAVKRRRFYFFNPIYTFKFGLKPRVLWKPLASIPIFRNFVTTAMYSVVGFKK